MPYRGGNMSRVHYLLIPTAALLLIAGCGKKAEEVQEPKAQPSRTSEELFDSFDDSDDAPVTADAEMDAMENENTSDMYGEPAFTDDGRYVVQVSTIASEAIAEDVARKLEKKGWPVYLAEVDNPTPELIGHYFRIRVGGFDNIADAKAFGEGYLVPAGYDYWVDNKSNDNVGVGGDSYLGDDAAYDTEDTYSSDYATEESDPYGFDETSAAPVEEAVVEEEVYEEPIVEETVVEEPAFDDGSAAVVEEPVVEETVVEEPVAEETVVEEPVVEEPATEEVYDATSPSDDTEPEVPASSDDWGSEEW